MEWVRMCRREAFQANSSIPKFVFAGKLDLYALICIIRFYLNSAFKACVRHEFAARETLLKLLFVYQARNHRAHILENNMVDLSEHEVLDSLGWMSSFLDQCGLKTEAERIDVLIKETSRLLKQDADANDTIQKYEMTVEEYQILVLYQALNDFEFKLDQQALGSLPSGQPSFKYAKKNRKSTIIFGAQVAAWSSAQKKRIEDANKHLEVVAKSRHWMFHNTGDVPDVAEVLLTMGRLLHFLQDIGQRAAATDYGDMPAQADWPWKLQNAQNGTIRVPYQPQLSGHGMSIPFPEDRNFVGRVKLREDLRAKILDKKLSPILVYGPPGVGKDTLVAQTVHMTSIWQCKQIRWAMWLQGSTDASFRTQLTQWFRVRLSDVVPVTMRKQADAIERIQTWLTSHNDWFMVVEDATETCKTLWEKVPFNNGRVVITSIERLDLHTSLRIDDDRCFEVPSFTTEDSLKLWEKMGVCGNPHTRPEINYSSEQEWRDACDATGGHVVYEGPKAVGDEGRCHRNMRKRLQIHAELSTPGIRDFLETDLGNLPLVVNLLGNMMREEKRSVQEVMVEFRTTPRLGFRRGAADMRHRGSRPFRRPVSLRATGHRPARVLILLRKIFGEDKYKYRRNGYCTSVVKEVTEYIYTCYGSMAAAQKRGYNRRTDRHPLGLLVSTRIVVGRMFERCKQNNELHQSVGGLLICMSVLDRSETPCALFQPEQWKQDKGAEPRLSTELFSKGGVGIFDEARAILRSYGFLLGTPHEDRAMVGTMHQLVQRVLWEELVKPAITIAAQEGVALPSIWPRDSLFHSSNHKWTADIVHVLLQVVKRHFRITMLDELMPQWIPCVKQLCNHLARPEKVCVSRFGKPTGHLFTTLCDGLRKSFGPLESLEQVKRAAYFHEHVLHSHMVTDENPIPDTQSMNYYGKLLNQLCKYEEAQLVFDKELQALRFKGRDDDMRRKLANQEWTVLSDMATICKALGRNEDSDKYEKEAKLLAEEDPVAKLTFKAREAHDFLKNGHAMKALQLDTEVVQGFQCLYPHQPGHIKIVETLNEMVDTYRILCQFEKAYNIGMEALALAQKHQRANKTLIAYCRVQASAGTRDYAASDAVTKEEANNLFHSARNMIKDATEFYETQGVKERVAECKRSLGNLCKLMSQKLASHKTRKLELIKESIQTHEEALRILRDIHQKHPYHPDIGNSMNDVACTHMLLVASGEAAYFDKAMKLYEEVIDFEEISQPDHIDRIGPMHNLLLLCCQQPQHRLKGLRVALRMVAFFARVPNVAERPDRPDILAVFKNRESQLYQLESKLDFPTILQPATCFVPRYTAKSVQVVSVMPPNDCSILYRSSSAASAVNAIIEGLQQKPEMNGKACDVHEFNCKRGRYRVVCNQDHFWLKPENVRLSVGTKVCIVNLESKKWIKVNYTVGTVKSALNESGRYEVELALSATISLKPVNLRVVVVAVRSSNN